MFVNRLDAGETIFLNRELESKLAQSRDVKHRVLRLLKENIIPINTEAGSTGAPKTIAGAPAEAPRAA